MMIPVFVSAPNSLNPLQDAAHRLILGELGHARIEARTLGRTDYPTTLPLREVYMLAKHCSGGVILGFSQFEATRGTWKRGTPLRKTVPNGKRVHFPTPWNHIEAGILFSLNLPLLVFRDSGIEGGIFDNGVTDVFVHPMPKVSADRAAKKALRAVFQKWATEVHHHYYQRR